MASVLIFKVEAGAGMVMCDCKDFHETCYNQAISENKNTLYIHRENKGLL